MSAMSIYLASAFDRGPELLGYAGELKDAGFTITADWIYGLEPDEDWEIALKDKADVERSDVLIAFTESEETPRASRGGRHVELGIALALDKRVLVIGPRENVFCHLPQVAHLPEWDAVRAIRLIQSVEG